MLHARCAVRSSRETLLFTFTSETGYTLNVGKLLHAPKVRDDLDDKIVDEADMIRLVYTARNHPRNHAIFRFLYHCGLRGSELCGLKWGDGRETATGAGLDILGKGGKVRHVSFI